jgi:hypothetical protein
VAEEFCSPECLCLVVCHKFDDVSEERATCILYPVDGDVTLSQCPAVSVRLHGAMNSKI